MRRRDFLPVAGAGAGAAGLWAAPNKKRVAGIVTEYRHYSHADVVLGRIMSGNSAEGVHHEPRTRLVSLYTAQQPQGTDMAPDMSSRYGFTLYPTIREALTLGGDKLAVDAVVFIGEHGKYPDNELGQKMYPRFELFSEVLDVFEASGRGVPTFFDKHLSYDWTRAKAMYDRAKKLNLPWMAGSSIPVTVRTPLLEIAIDTPLDAAVAVGYGPLDAYGFHLLEALQCMVERRAGGETGVSSVEWIQGNGVWDWLKGTGAWARPLVEAAAARNPHRKPQPIEDEAKNPVLFVLNYTDGLKGAGLILGPSGADWTFACRRKNASDIDSTFFGLPKRGRTLPHFDGLVKCMEDMFISGKPLYPVERTLLTTGMLALLFQSKKSGGRRDTPELAVAYRAPKNCYFQRS